MNLRFNLPSNLRVAIRSRWRTLWLALAGIFVLTMLSQSREDATAAVSPSISTTLDPSTKVDVVAKPSPELSPEDVVQKQMQALSAAGPVAERIDRCYRFASPANREHTGPIERFSAMVQGPAYQALLDATHFLVGRATRQKNEAYLLVTTVDAAGELTLFRFFLSKQEKAPYAGCWMTDAVIRVGAMKPPAEPRKPRRESPTI